MSIQRHHSPRIGRQFLLKRDRLIPLARPHRTEFVAETVENLLAHEYHRANSVLVVRSDDGGESRERLLRSGDHDILFNRSAPSPKLRAAKDAPSNLDGLL